MLHELRMQDFAIVEECHLEFGPGLNVLTGETGAGKSIVIDAVAAVLGGRAGTAAVRQGASRAVVDASFELEKGAAAADLLEELGLLDEENVILTREVAAEGRNKCRINARPTNVSTLAEIGRTLVDIHGQHDHQSLLSVANHVHLLDALGGASLRDVAREVARLAAEYAEVRRAIRDLEEGDRHRAQQEDLMRFQLSEIDEADLAPGEDEELASERARLTHAERIARALSEAYYALYGGDDMGDVSAVSLVGRAKANVEDSLQYDDRLEEPYNTLEQALAAIEDVSGELRRRFEEAEADPERLAAIEERLSLIARLKRKYGESVDDILAFHSRIARQLELVQGADESLAQLRTQERSLARQLAECASRLSEGRKRAAEVAEREIARRLAGLQMPEARFQVAITRRPDEEGIVVDDERVHIGPHGVDHVEFLFSANPGQEVRPLARIASGGEMSRVMLAIKGALAEIDPVGTLIFDEVDAGLGGRAAESVAEALAELASTHQVIVVTHLAQIAARGDRHFVVEKGVERGQTHITVRRVEGEARVRELARMLDGKETQTGYEHAKELLALAHKGKAAS